MTAVDTEPTDGAVIEVRGVVTRFGRQTIHDGLDLAVPRGEILGVVGGSGTGKTVLLRTIIGLQRPAEGSVVLLGQPVSWDGSSTRALAGRFGMLFQDGALFSSLTVAQNIAVPLAEHTSLSPELCDEIADVKINLVGLPLDAAAAAPEAR